MISFEVSTFNQKRKLKFITQDTNEVKRSDNFSHESNTEVDAHNGNENEVTISEPNNNAEVTKEGKTESINSFEYYSNDSTEDMVHSS